MHRFLVLVLVLQVSLIFGVHFELVSGLVEQPNHLGLLQLDDREKLDDNQELGALLIINCGIPDVYFENTISKIYQGSRSGSYWVVLKKRAQYLLIKKDGYPDFRYQFPIPLKGGTVYQMTIDEKSNISDDLPVLITSNEDDASIYLDGDYVGKIKDRAFTTYVPVGEHVIELRKDRFRTKTVRHNVGPNNSIIKVNLVPKMKINYSITTEHSGASVYIDEKMVGTSPLNYVLLEGEYTLRLEEEGFIPITDRIIVDESNRKKHYILEDLRATLTIHTSDKATIKLNGKEYNYVQKLKLPASVVKIEVSQAKAKTIERVVTLKQKEVRTLNLYPEIAHGTISVIPTPTTAKIELNGDAGEYYKDTSRTSFKDIPVGKYELVVTNSGYKTHTDHIKLKDGDVIHKEIKLIKEAEKPKKNYKKWNFLNNVHMGLLIDQKKFSEDSLDELNNKTYINYGAYLTCWTERGLGFRGSWVSGKDNDIMDYFSVTALYGTRKKTENLGFVYSLYGGLGYTSYYSTNVSSYYEEKTQGFNSIVGARLWYFAVELNYSYAKIKSKSGDEQLDIGGLGINFLIDIEPLLFIAAMSLM